MAEVKKKILFVDDEFNILNALKTMLRGKQGEWDMIFASSAEEALGAAGRVSFDAIVSDVKMPGKDGFELLKALGEMEHTKDIPVIIVTGNNEVGLKKKALDLGASDLLNKPIDLKELLARIGSALRLKYYQDQLKIQNETLEQKVRERTQALEHSRLDILWRLGKAAEYRDEATGNHVVRVGCSSRILAKALGMGDEFAQMLFLTSPLHDIGKIGIPDYILLKPAQLDRSEWDIMMQHSVIGARILRQDSMLMTAFQQSRSTGLSAGPEQNDNPILQMASSIALTHHEKWDGSGYPEGLAGSLIPLESRIVALADVYDALRSDRPYHAGYPEEEALEVMRRGVGVHFDPEVHAAFERTVPEIEAIRSRFSDADMASARRAQADPPSLQISSPGT